MEKTKRILNIVIRIAAFLAVAYVVGYLIGLAVRVFA